MPTCSQTVKRIFAAAALLLPLVMAPAEAKGLVLFSHGSVAAIRYVGPAPIGKAAALLAHDLTALSGQQPEVKSGTEGSAPTTVIIGLANDPAMAALLKANGISTAAIDGKWESYGRAVISAPGNGKRLLIFGSDVRGTIWGVIDLTREMGVSAWEWWADVKIHPVASLTVDAGTRFSKEPSVKYRGFFINTGLLTNWTKKTFDTAQGGVGPKTYARVFELMWRLKANMLWPAMGGEEQVFNDAPANYDLAKEYAVVRGSSHVEMMLRNNAHEWNAKTMGPYNWLVNKQKMVEYWRGDVEKYGQYENQYTVGLRGADDFPMEGADTPEKMADVLDDAIAEQRKILGETLKQPADQIPQVFTPYKEVTAAYNTGRMRLPGDVTIVWPDDNYGYVMQLDNAAERQRPGGSGVYYHLTFWGAPAAYLWLASTDPTLVWEEMMKSYHFDARTLWVVNSGSIKPCEFLTQFFLEMAFDADAFAKPQSVQAYLRDWVGQNFGLEHRDAIARILWQYYKLSFDRNPEFMTGSTTFPETSVQQSKFNMLDFGDENARRAAAFQAMMDETAKIMAAMPEDRKAAFYELVQYTVNTGANLNLRQLDLDKAIAYGLQNRASANVYAEKAAAAQENIAADTRAFNKTIENGKWDGIIQDYPHPLPNYEAPAIPAWKAAADARRCGVQVEGGGYFDDKQWWYPTLPAFHRELAGSYYLDVFTEQPVDAEWSATPNAAWIKLDHSAGHFSPAAKRFEQRIQVSVDWSKAPKAGEGTITFKCSAGQQPIDVHVRLAPPLADNTVSFIDAQGVVSLYAAHADTLAGHWQVLDGVGHTGADLQADLDLAPVDANDAAALAKAPHAVYRFATLAPDRDYSFPNYVIDTVATIKAFALPSFPITKGGHLRIAIVLDGGQPKVLDYNVEYYGAKWRENVLNNVAVVALHDVPIKPGSHTLAVYALDPGVTLDRFEIDFAGASPAYGPVPETRIVRNRQ